MIKRLDMKPVKADLNHVFIKNYMLGRNVLELPLKGNWNWNQCPCFCYVITAAYKKSKEDCKENRDSWSISNKDWLVQKKLKTQVRSWWLSN